MSKIKLHLHLMFCALLGIIENTITLLSLGFLDPLLTMKYLVWNAEREYRRKSNL